jgi:hypothetical protein
LRLDRLRYRLDAGPAGEVEQAQRLGELQDIGEALGRVLAQVPGLLAEISRAGCEGTGRMHLRLSLAATAALAVVAVLALYRLGSFIHEITHMKDDSVPGYRLGWNLVAGIPLMIPSFMYEGVHNLHHARNRYGTARDPEYMALALKPKISVPLFVMVAALGPIGLIIRWGLLAPLSLLKPVRDFVRARFSALSINPDFRRDPPAGPAAARWNAMEVATSLFVIAVLAAVATGLIPLRAFGIWLAVLSASMVINQIRTLAAHLWENDGKVMSITDQYLDSVNVPPPALLPSASALSSMAVITSRRDGCHRRCRRDRCYGRRVYGRNGPHGRNRADRPWRTCRDARNSRRHRTGWSCR